MARIGGHDLTPFKDHIICVGQASRLPVPRRPASVSLPFLGWLLFLILSTTSSSHANVYASDVRLGYSANNAASVPGRPVLISYILNEPATAGVSVRIFSGTNVARAFSFAAGIPGATTGSNAVLWNCQNQSGSNLPPGIYSIQITASASGYPTWTNITDDGPQFAVPQPSAIAVNKNISSPFYGRVFVSSAPGGAQAPGVFKFNADGSPADEGGFSTGGYSWQDASPPGYSPWKISISADDKVYINDWSGSGIILAFDEMISTNFAYVLTPLNYPYANPDLSGPFVQGVGTNAEIWMADANANGAGVIRWSLGSGGVIASNDLGSTIIADGAGSNLGYAPYDVTVDSNGNIYTIQNVDGADAQYGGTGGGVGSCPGCAAMMRVLCFPPYSGQQETVATWEMGAFSNSLDIAYGISVDPTARYLAVAARGDGGGLGHGNGEILQNGGITILYATNGMVITNINQNADGTTNMQCWDVAWDNVGNLYTTQITDGTNEVWRVYSPPGTNQSTTPGVPIVQLYNALTPPILSGPTIGSDATGNAQFQFMLQGQSNVTYLIEESSDLMSWSVIATNYSTAALRAFTIQPTDQQGFYRAQIAPAF